jgi:hypothetical protein
VIDGVYGVYHPDYDAHVYRNVHLQRVVSEPINRGHDDDSIQYGSFTYDGLKIEDCRVGRDPLIQLTCTSPKPGVEGHFRNLEIRNSASNAKVVDLGGGPRNPKLENAVPYLFHDYPMAGRTLRVVSARFPQAMQGADYHTVEGFTGPDVRAAEVDPVPFPDLLAPIDDLPPATSITSAVRSGSGVVVRGVTQDNGEIASVTVNGKAAKIISSQAGVTDWEIILPPKTQTIRASATDRAGNVEKLVHAVTVP